MPPPSVIRHSSSSVPVTCASPPPPPSPPDRRLSLHLSISLLYCSPPPRLASPPLLGHRQNQHLLVRLLGQPLPPLRCGLHARAARQRHLSHLRLHQQVRMCVLTHQCYICRARRDVGSALYIFGDASAPSTPTSIVP